MVDPNVIEEYARLKQAALFHKNNTTIYIVIKLRLIYLFN